MRLRGVAGAFTTRETTGAARNDTASPFAIRPATNDHQRRFKSVLCLQAESVLLSHDGIGWSHVFPLSGEEDP
jgi:hypothetical protein